MGNGTAQAAKTNPEKAQGKVQEKAETQKPANTSMKSYFKQQMKQAPTKQEKRTERAEQKLREAWVEHDDRPRTKDGRLAKEKGRKQVRMRPGGLTQIQMMIHNHEEFSGMSNDAIAARVGCSVSSVRRVKAELRKQGYYPTTITQRVHAALKKAKPE